ncbi:hypothetical protein LCGC14_1341320 [marine sediment metagenome]|uniref:Uncharacterized protein n=1 Tax=marine sediment metagenome TaxID=412755 RepID=A0A0F9L013_9ZZZZ
MTKREEIVEQVLMERYRQPSGVFIKLCLLEIPKGLVGHPYTLERQVNGQWQHRSYGKTYGKAMEEFNSYKDFERHIGSVRTLLGGIDVN